MSDSRTSSRIKKKVTYSGFDEGDGSDDDFARATPPPSKRTKLEKKNKLSKTKTGAAKTESKEKKSDALIDRVNVTSRGPRKERVSLDKKVFDREMELALEMSMNESQDSQTNQSTTNKQTSGRTKDIEAVINTMSTSDTPHLDNVQSKDKENLVVKPTRPSTSFPAHSDEIILVESLDEDEVATGRRKRKAAKDAVAKQREMASKESDGGDDDEDDFKADAVNDSSSDDYDAGDGDSDYDEFISSKKTTKTAKSKGKSPRCTERGRKTGIRERTKKTSGNKKPQLATKASPPVTPLARHSAATGPIRGFTPKASPPVTPLARHPAATGPIKGFTPKASPPVTPLARHPAATGPIRGFTPPAVTRIKNSQQTDLRVPQPSSAVARKPWSSPSSESNPLGGVKLVSPGQPLRLGLSRNVRIKPLHPNSKVH